LPVFTGGSSEKIRIAPDQVQIDTTHFRPQHHAKSALSRTHLALNRTAVILSTKRALRALDFSRRVLSAYEHKCAFCGLQLRLVDGAHILPASHPHSTDQTANGIALCALHHRAYDRGLLTFDSKFTVHINEPMVKTLADSDRTNGLKEFKRALRPLIAAPADKKDRPALQFVVKANELRGWKLEA
jgi:putative restriction endonuclease